MGKGDGVQRMRVGKPDERKPVRHPLWSKQAFLEYLRRTGSAKEACSIYTPAGKTWRTTYNDVFLWRKEDPEFDADVKEAMGAKNQKGGRPRIDGGDKAWQDEYCRVLIEQNGNEDAARGVTPYSSRQMSEFLSQTSTSYDKEFAEKVQDAWSRIAGPNQSATFGAVHEIAALDIANDPTAFVKAKIIETKARVASKALEKALPERYGNRLNVQGRVDHVHSQDRYLTQGQMVAKLLEDRERFLENRQKMMLPADTEVVVEAEPVDVEVVEAQSES